MFCSREGPGAASAVRAFGGSADPVAANRDPAAIRDSGRVEDSAAAFDHRRRSDIVVIAGRQHVCNAKRPRDNKTLLQNRCCVTTAAKRRAYTESDVSALARKERVQLMA